MLSCGCQVVVQPKGHALPAVDTGVALFHCLLLRCRCCAFDSDAVATLLSQTHKCNLSNNYSWLGPGWS